MPCSHLILSISRIFCRGWWGESRHITPRVLINSYCILLFWHPCCVLLKVIFGWAWKFGKGQAYKKDEIFIYLLTNFANARGLEHIFFLDLTVQAPLWGQEKIYIQSNLFNMDTKGTESINCPLYRSVCIIELAGEICMIFGLSGTKQTVHNREVSVRRG